MERYNVCIVGAGPAGMSAAIEAAKLNKKVILLDKNKKCGNKLYATGNGRCNITNEHFDDKVYFDDIIYTDSNSDSDPDKESILGSINPYNEVITYIKSLGINTVSRNNYVYPLSMQASTVVWAFTDKLKQLGVTINTNFNVTDINKKDDHFVITNGIQTVMSDKLILALGGPAAPGLGTVNEDWFRGLSKKLKLDINAFEPALCPLYTSEDTSFVSGVRHKASASLFIEDNLIDIESGEIQFTEYGLSGIAIFNLSGYIKKNAKARISLDLIPDIEIDKLLSEFASFKTNNSGRTVLAFMNSFINDKLALYILNLMGINPKQIITSLETVKAMDIINHMKALSFNIKTKYDYTKAQASSGGIKLDTIDTNIMKLKADSSISVCGEIVDICGKCGGYNITWAILSGIIAGRNV